MIESSISFFIDILVLFGNNKVTNIFASNFFKKRLKVRFFGRQKELQRIKDFLNRPQTGAMLILGKRRVGKTTLIKKALEDSDITSVIYTCIPSDLNTNLLLLSKAVSTSLNFPEIGFSNIQSLFDFLNTLGKKIVIVLDEYQDMKKREDSLLIDALFRNCVDSLSENVRLILSGSSIRMMSKLNDSDNPLFGRFSDIIMLNELTAFEAAEFYPDATVRDKIFYYGIFGGMPNILQRIDEKLGVTKNIERLFLDTGAIAYSYAKSVVDVEVSPINDAFTILNSIGNGKKRYTELLSSINSEKGRSQLSRTLNTLVDSGILSKKKPINKDSRTSTFYEITSPCLRFYFAYLINFEGYQGISSNTYYDEYISPSINTFVSYRFEDIVAQYFSKLSLSGKRSDILAIGSYWFDDKIKKLNGEYDCALKTPKGYEIYECKLLKNKAPKSLIEEEKRKAMNAEGINIARFGVVSSSGFEEEVEGVIMIDGEELYNS